MLLFILTTLLSILSKGDKPELATFLIPEELIENAYSVVRFSETTYDITSARKYTYRVHRAVTILDERSGHDVLTVSYDKYSKAHITSAAIYDKTGKLVRTIKRQEITDQSHFDGFSLYSDNRYLRLDLRGGKYPYTVEYSFEVDYHETMSYGDWRPQSFYTSVQSASLKINLPVGLSIHTKALNREIKMREEIVDGKTRQNWEMVDLAAQQWEIMSPPGHTVFPMVIVSPDQFSVEGYEGSMQDWKAFGKFIHELNDGKDALTPAMAAKVKSLVQGISDPEKKIRILYNYIKKNMRYVSVQLGIGGWQAFDASYVEENKYGDCKALSYFMKGMLHEAGIEAYPVLIAAGKEAFFIDEFAAPFFNHMMLHVPETDTWLECTSNEYPTGYIGEWTAQKEVLLITPEGGVRAKTPAAPRLESRTSTVDSIYFSNNNWQVKSRHGYYEGSHELCRRVENYLADSEQEKRFRENFPLSIESVNALDYSSLADKPEAWCTFELTLEHFGSISGSRYFIPANPLYRFDANCSKSEREMEIFSSEPNKSFHTMYLEIPPGYKVENLPKPKSIAYPEAGNYSLTVEQIENVMIVKREFLHKAFRLPADQYEGLCDFYGKVESADKARIVLVKE